MRLIFSLIGLLIVVAIVGILTKSQLSVVTQLPNQPQTEQQIQQQNQLPTQLPTQLQNPTTSGADVASNPTAPSNIAEQSKQIQTQVKEQVNAAMKTATEAQQKAIENGNVGKASDTPTAKITSAF